MPCNQNFVLLQSGKYPLIKISILTVTEIPSDQNFDSYSQTKPNDESYLSLSQRNTQRSKCRFLLLEKDPVIKLSILKVREIPCDQNFDSLPSTKYPLIKELNLTVREIPNDRNFDSHCQSITLRSKA